MLLYCAYRCIPVLSAVLPSSFRYWLARRLADLGWLLCPRARRGLESNLRAALGAGAEAGGLRRVSRSAFRSFGIYLAEFFAAGRHAERLMGRRVRVTGRENLDRALALGRGALFVSAHYSNWELGAFVVGRLGYPILIVAQAHADRRINGLFVRQRAVHGVEVASSEHGARAALRALRENRPVAILGDRPTGGQTVRVSLCGRPAEFPQGPWRLGLDSSAPLLPTFVCRQPDGSYDLEIGAPLEWPTAGAREERAAALAQAFARELEARLRRDPAQWAAFYPVWETAQSGAPAMVHEHLACDRGQKANAGARA
jgi:KDO2-lipid IV(A) lauroyltransferase